MKTIKASLLLMILVGSTSIFAKDFNCIIKVNTEEVHNTSFELKSGDTVTFADSSSLKFYLKSLEEHRYELQVFDGIATTRAYTIGNMKESGDVLSYVLWSRSSIIDIECVLK